MIENRKLDNKINSALSNFIPFVSVVIPTYNRKAHLKISIESLFDQTYPSNKYEVIVVDDGSNDGTEEIVKKLIEKSPIILKYFKQKNGGPARARNFGIKNANGQIIAFTDDDCTADKDWLKNIVGAFENKSTGGVEGRVVMLSERTPFTQNVENLDGGKYITANMAYRKYILTEVGMFNENFPFPVYEDTDLAHRVLKNNRKIVYSENAVVFHPNEEISFKKFLKTLRYLRSSLLLKDLNPELYKLKAKNGFAWEFFFVIFLRPFSLKHWAYLIHHPSKIFKYITMSVVLSISYMYLASLMTWITLSKFIYGRFF